MIIYARLLIATFCVLALAGSASAECAWVLWTRPTAADRAKLKLNALWRVGRAYETRARCEKQAPGSCGSHERDSGQALQPDFGATSGSGVLANHLPLAGATGEAEGSGACISIRSVMRRA
jgi:hypothetical protein